MPGSGKSTWDQQEAKLLKDIFLPLDGRKVFSYMNTQPSEHTLFNTKVQSACLEKCLPRFRRNTAVIYNRVTI